MPPASTQPPGRGSAGGGDPHAGAPEHFTAAVPARRGMVLALGMNSTAIFFSIWTGTRAMSTARADLTNPQRRLPELTLRSTPEGELTPLNGFPRKSPMLILVHRQGCPSCRAHLDDLALHHDAITEWDAHVMIISPDPHPAGDAAPGKVHPFPFLMDPDQRLASALSLQPPATVIADQWGEVRTVHEAGQDHRFLTPAELAEWAKYLAVQCPECQGEAL
jgi:peroxiredoxin